MALTFDQQLRILSKGVESVVHECEQTKIIHYHFIGAPFYRVTLPEFQRARDEKRAERNPNFRLKEPKKPLRISYDNDEGWEVVYELASLSRAETFVVEEIIKKQRIFLTRAHEETDEFDPRPHFKHLEKEIAFGETACRALHELAKHRNKLMHALNGNIIQVGDVFVRDGELLSWSQDQLDAAVARQFNECVGKTDNDVDYISLLNELDMFENKKITFNFEMTTMSSGIASISVREMKVFATGRGSSKKKSKENACFNLLKKLLSTYYFDLKTGYIMKCRHIFPAVAALQSASKENTKRDNKPHRHDNRERASLLRNKGFVEEARRKEKVHEHNRLMRIHAKQEKQEKARVDKIIAQLQSSYNRDFADLQWKVPVDVRFGDFKEFMEAVEGFFTDDVKKVLDWASVANCMYLIYSNPDALVKWNACDNLRRILGIKTMSLTVFASMIFHVLKQLGFVSKNTHPDLQTFQNSSTLSILITLILTFVHRKTPRSSVVEALVNTCKDLPLASRGMGLLEDVVKRVCQYVRGVENLEDVVPNTLKKIEERVAFYNTKDGLALLTVDEKTFVEICKLRLDIVNLSATIDARSIYYQKFLVLKGHVNNMYTIAQRSPVAGCGRRKRPIVFHVWGDAGIGKSRIIKLIAADTISTILTLEGYGEEDLNEALETYDQFVYYRPVGVQYEQNFVSTRAKIYVCDDANQVDAKHLQHGTPFPQAIIHLNNEHDHMLPVAELEMKSQALFKSALVIATDNKQTPDLSYLQSPEAYHRRIDFSYQMVLKDEFSRMHKGSRMIDVTTLDLTQPNEHIYEFHSGGQIYSYNDVVAILRNELRDVHKRFKDETVVFTRRAQKSREQMREEEAAPEYVADLVQNAIRPERQVNSGIQNEIRVAGNRFRNHRLQLDDIEEIPRTETSFFSQFSPSTDTPPVDGFFKSWFIFFILSRLPISWATKVNDFLFGSERKNVMRRRIVLATVTLLLTSFAAYKLYEKFSKPSEGKKKKRSFKQPIVEEEVVQQKYNDGQPKSVKQKEKSPSDKPVVVVPIHKTQNNTFTITKIDVREYVNSNETQLASPLAYRTEKMVLQNMYIMILEYKRNGVFQYSMLRGFFLNDRCLITNRHFFAIEQEEYETATVSLFNVFREYLRIPTSQLDVMSFAHEDEKDSLYYDLVAIKFPCSVKSHIDLTMRDEMESNFIKMCDMDRILHQNVTLVTVCEAVEFEKINGIDTMIKNPQWLFLADKQRTAIRAINKNPLPATDPNGEMLYTWKTVSYDAQTIPGSCGSVLISNSAVESGKIIGIHMAGFCATDDAFGQIITAEMVQALKPYCQMRYKPGKAVTILPNDFPIIDTISRPLFMPSDTKIRKTICHEEIFPTTKAPAKLKYSRNEEHGAVTAIRKYLNPSIHLSCDDQAICSSYLKYYFKPTRRVCEVTRDVAIRGIEGNRFIQAINRKSSCGYPLSLETKESGKHEYLGKDDNFITDHPRLMSLIEKIECDVKEGKRPEIYFSVTMKDELKKIEKPLARIFAAGPLQYTVLFREYFIDYFAAVMEQRVFNTSLIGINMLSTDVDVLVSYLLEVTHRDDKAFIAGDFKNFDGTLMTCLLWEIFAVIESFYERKSAMTRALWQEITDSRQIFGNAVAHIASGQPSGNPATTFINTMYNTALLHLVITKILFQHGTTEAFEMAADLSVHLRVLTYGDDNILAFSPSLRRMINPLDITKMMTTYGHTYTNDAKDGKDLEYKTLSEISILKRTFSYDVRHGWIAPLELESILECLNWDKVDKRKREEKRAQTVVNMRVAIRELSLHTQPIFEKYRQAILTSAERHRLVLPPECYFSQTLLRNLTRSGDNLFYFSDDFNIFVDHKLRQSFYSGYDENQPIQVQDVWPRLEMKQWSAQQQNENQSNNIVEQQILVYDKETTIVKETVPEPTSLPEAKLYQMEEIRDHSVRDIVSRVYTIADQLLPTGGLSGDIVYTVDPLAALLSQTNVKAKLSKFLALRTNIMIRLLLSTARTCSGAIMIQYIPPLGTQRSNTLLQQSQSIREVISLSTGAQVDLEAPWVEPFIGRNLASSTGKLGTYRISRVTPSQTDAVRMKIQIFCPAESLRVEYPTFLDQAVSLAELKVERERIDQLLARMDKKPSISVKYPVASMQMVSLRNLANKFAAMRPQHEPSTSPLTVVKWQPGKGHLNDHARVPTHSLTTSCDQGVETSEGQFGSKIDEMEIERIMRSKNIIAVFPVSTADATHTVVYARPCTIIDFIGTTSGTPPVTTLSISHQMFAASLAQQWQGKLHHEFHGTHNQFHSYQLRSMFVPGDTGKYSVGQVMSTDDVNAVRGEVHKFGADKMIGEHVVEPMLTTNMKNVPSPRNAAGVASLANFTANRFTDECSYGMLYVTIEVPLIASAQVAPTVYVYVDFYASDVILAEPEVWGYLIPQTQMKGIEGESLAQDESKTKSTIISRGSSTSTIGRMPDRETTIKESLGESIHHLMQLATAGYVFSNSFTATSPTAYLISPFIFRTAFSQIATDVGQYNDLLDFLMSGFAYMKGGVTISIGKRGALTQEPFGEAILVNSRNNFTGTSLGTPNGIQTIPAPNSASSFARSQPLYVEECLVRIHVPYMQPFGVNRTTTSDGFQNGSNRKYLLMRPYATANNRFFRSASKDFSLGFLTSLPQYTLNVASTIYT